MFYDEFSQIKTAADEYIRLSNTIQEMGRRRTQLESHRKQGEPIKLGFIGNTGTIEIPSEMQGDLFDWIDAHFADIQNKSAARQEDLTCPAGTNCRQKSAEPNN